MRSDKKCCCRVSKRCGYESYLEGELEIPSIDIRTVPYRLLVGAVKRGRGLKAGPASKAEWEAPLKGNHALVQCHNGFHCRLGLEIESLIENSSVRLLNLLNVLGGELADLVLDGMEVVFLAVALDQNRIVRELNVAVSYLD